MNTLVAIALRTMVDMFLCLASSPTKTVQILEVESLQLYVWQNGLVGELRLQKLSHPDRESVSGYNHTYGKKTALCLGK